MSLRFLSFDPPQIENKISAPYQVPGTRYQFLLWFHPTRFFDLTPTPACASLADNPQWLAHERTAVIVKH